ncbi:hypothetical protein FF38_07066 [Lucilia cuprina]|uniref:Ionotropic glutamate receptor C-terminal domain-containing protein n=1 Tax=Lucilia cuprina TaxID=7375 RepID=A0A0L0CH29_LUCCU|nr:hypothetical protein FF38_07066 [Lucilia cuprina]
MNKQLNIEWNLIVSNSCENKREMEDLLRNNEKSIVLKTLTDNEEGENELNLLFGYNVMTIIFHDLKFEKVYLQDLEIILEKLVNILKFMHFTTILWILDVETEQVKYVQKISELCWHQGFVRVVFICKQNMYTYTPLPIVKVLKLTSLKQFYKLKDIVNYHQVALRFPITSSPPRCYRYTDPKGNFVYAGYFYEILMIFIKQYNFKFIEYPSDYNSNNKEVLLQDLVSNKIDALPFMAYHNRNYAASDVLWNVNVVIMVPNAKPISKYLYFVKPFKHQIWLLYLLLVIIYSLLLGLVIYVKNKKMDFSKSLIYVLSLSIYQHHLNIFKNFGLISNLVYILLFLFGFIMVQMYLCKLSSMLVLTIYEPQIETVQDISATDLKVFMYKPDLKHFVSKSALTSIILERIILTDGIDLDNKRRSLNASYFHMGFEDKINFFLLQQKFLKVPLVQLIHPVILTEPIFFTMRHNLPYIQLFNRYLKYLADSGLLQKILQNIEKDGIQSGEIYYFKDKEELNDNLLSLEYFYAPLVLYICGIALSFIAFLMEICFNKFYVKLSRIK